MSVIRRQERMIASLVTAALVAAYSPTLMAGEDAAAEPALPAVFQLSSRGEGMSDELVFRLLTVTAVNRLQAAAASDPELNALKYDDTMAAFAAAGIKWEADTTVSISRDEDAGEDVVTIGREGTDAVLRYDDAGKQVVSEVAGNMSSRTSSVDNALTCCWMKYPTSACKISYGTCADNAEKCWSNAFSAANGFGNGYVLCSSQIQ